MYATGTMYFNYFENDAIENTEKVIYCRLSESIQRTDRYGQPIISEEGKKVYDFESWNCRIMGKAREKFEKNPLKDCDSIIVTECNFRNPYYKEDKKNYPYLCVYDYEPNNKEKLPDDIIK